MLLWPGYTHQFCICLLGCWMLFAAISQKFLVKAPSINLFRRCLSEREFSRNKFAYEKGLELRTFEHGEKHPTPEQAGVELMHLSCFYGRIYTALTSSFLSASGAIIFITLKSRSLTMGTVTIVSGLSFFSASLIRKDTSLSIPVGVVS